MTTPRASLPSLRAYLGAIALSKTSATSVHRALYSLQGGLTQNDTDVRDVVNALVASFDAFSSGGGDVIGPVQTSATSPYAIPNSETITRVDLVTGDVTVQLPVAAAVGESHVIMEVTAHQAPNATLLLSAIDGASMNRGTNNNDGGGPGLLGTSWKQATFTSQFGHSFSRLRWNGAVWVIVEFCPGTLNNA